MAHRPVLVLASRNVKKIRELEAVVGPLGMDVRSSADYRAAPEVEETGSTFAENAELKAVQVAQAVGTWALADDSGLAVDALQGAPGVYSARYAGPDATDESNNEKLLNALRGVPTHERGAQYVCHLVLSDAEGHVVTRAEATCRGVILEQPAGAAGFGYDPLFWVPEYHRTFGQLGLVVKEFISHRSRALRQITPALAAAGGECHGSERVIRCDCAATSNAESWGLLSMTTNAYCPSKSRPGPRVPKYRPTPSRNWCHCCRPTERRPPMCAGFGTGWSTKVHMCLRTPGWRLRTSNSRFPIPRPSKLFLLAGNYAAHIEEGGGQAVERSETFPYVFMKPPSTTLLDPGVSFKLPNVSPANMDYELELAVVMGRMGKEIDVSEALDHVAGYTVVNDLSDRQFRPFPQRRERPRDSFLRLAARKVARPFLPLWSVCGVGGRRARSAATSHAIGCQRTSEARCLH